MLPPTSDLSSPSLEKEKPRKARKPGYPRQEREQRKRAALAMVRDGLSVPEISRYLEINWVSVMRWARQSGLPVRSHAAPQVLHTRDLALQRLHGGQPPEGVAEALGISTWSLLCWAQEGLRRAAEDRELESLRAEAIAELRQGVPARHVARRLQVHVFRVLRWAHEEGVTFSKGRPPRPPMAEAVAALRQGLGTQQVAQRFSVSPYLVRKWAAEEGIAIDRRGRPVLH